MTRRVSVLYCGSPLPLFVACVVQDAVMDSRTLHVYFDNEPNPHNCNFNNPTSSVSASCTLEWSRRWVFSKI